MSTTPTVAEITPTVGEVASHILHRTRDRPGNLLKTFTEETVPTKAEAEAKALEAAQYVALKLGTVHTTWDGDLVATARSVASRFAALYIENGVPDGNAPSEASVIELGRIAREFLGALLDTAKDNQPGSRPFTTISLIGEMGGAEPPFLDEPLGEVRPLRLRKRLRRA